MKRHLPLLVPFLLLAACNKTADAPADAAAAPAADTAAATAPATDATSTDTAAATPTVPAETKAKTNLVEGVDYVLIPNGQPLQPLDGKVEVVEVFAYWCGHCFALEPSLEAWKTKLPADVRFTAVPLSGGPNDTMARVYYAAETTGQLDKVHGAMFNGIHVERGLAPNASADEITAYLGKKGVDSQALAAAMNSFAMSGRLGQGMQFAQRSGVEGTPTLIVNGKYRILGKSHDDQLQIANGLIAQERAASAQ